MNFFLQKPTFNFFNEQKVRVSWTQVCIFVNCDCLLILFLFENVSSLTGPLPDPKKPRVMHGTLIMKENVSSSFLRCSWVRGWAFDHVAPSHLSPSAEPEAGVIRAGPEGTRPQRTSVTLHLPRATPGPAQRQRHTSQNLHTPQEVRAHLRNKGRFRICSILKFSPHSVDNYQ